MCGICGIYHFDGARPARRADLQRMTDELRRRGPDDEGLWDDRSAALGARRLSILDVEGGHQPLSNEDGSVWAQQNGEIFNYPELKERLEGKGHRFRTRTDTEVLVHLYEERGPDMVEDLRGMYAISVYDRNRRRLVLARDRVGKKPLYVWEPEGSLYFASELKSLMALPGFPRRLSRSALSAYLCFAYVPSPSCILEGVRQVEPGEVDVIEPAGVRRSIYWRPDFEPDRGGNPLERVRESIDRSVRRRLVSDVPLGVFLSGGVDSSVVASVAVRESKAPLKSFAIGFDDPSFDESAYASRVAREIGTEHRCETLTLRNLVDLVPEVSEFIDEPFADASVLPTYALCRFARKEVTVAISGDGGDEIFLGYPTFPAEKLARLAAAFLAPSAAFFSRLAALLPVRHGYWPVRTQLVKFLRALECAPVRRHHLWIGAFEPAELGRLLADEPDTEAGWPPRPPQASSMDQVFWFYFRYWLGDGILTKVDRASMAASLEVRSPLLDDDLISMMLRFPLSVRLPGMRRKALLKDAADSRLPREVFARRKQGFAVPMARWLCEDLKPMAQDLLSPARLKAQGLFRPQAVTKLLREHWERREDHQKRLWTLLCFQLWYERWMNAKSA